MEYGLHSPITSFVASVSFFVASVSFLKPSESRLQAILWSVCVKRGGERNVCVCVASTLSVHVQPHP